MACDEITPAVANFMGYELPTRNAVRNAVRTYLFDDVRVDRAIELVEDLTESCHHREHICSNCGERLRS